MIRSEGRAQCVQPVDPCNTVGACLEQRTNDRGQGIGIPDPLEDVLGKAAPTRRDVDPLQPQQATDRVLE